MLKANKQVQLEAQKTQAQLEAQQAFDMLKGSLEMQEQYAAAAAAAAAVHVSVYTINQELTAQTLSLKEQVASLNEQLRSLGIYAEREHSAACAKASHVIALERANRDLEERTRVALERQRCAVSREEEMRATCVQMEAVLLEPRSQSALLVSAERCLQDQICFLQEQLPSQHAGLCLAQKQLKGSVLCGPEV